MSIILLLTYTCMPSVNFRHFQFLNNCLEKKALSVSQSDNHTTSSFDWMGYTISRWLSFCQFVEIFNFAVATFTPRSNIIQPALLFRLLHILPVSHKQVINSSFRCWFPTGNGLNGKVLMGSMHSAHCICYTFLFFIFFANLEQ